MSRPRSPQTARLAAAFSGTVLLASLALAPAALAQDEGGNGGSPTGPIFLPAVGVGLDPLAPGKREEVEAKSQPNASQLPYFSSGMGWFGSGFARPSPGSSAIGRVGVATGDERVFVGAGGSRRVHIYDAESLTSIASFGPGGAESPSGSWQSLQGLAHNRGELYVLGVDNSQQRVRVFDSSGDLVRVLASLGPAARQAGLFEGIDAAWGELWVASLHTPQGSADAAGQQVIVLDAQSGAIKGIARQPLSDAALSDSGRGWWDVSIAPEIKGAIVDQRVFRRNELLPGLPSADSPLCPPVLLYNCASTNQAGTDAPWGMRWFLELPS